MPKKTSYFAQQQWVENEIKRLADIKIYKTYIALHNKTMTARFGSDWRKGVKVLGNESLQRLNYKVREMEESVRLWENMSKDKENRYVPPPLHYY